MDTKALQRIVWGGLLLVIFSIVVAYVRTQVQPAPPALPVLSQVAPFQLTNQLGQPVTLHDLQGKVWLANIIFTRCPGPCAQMSRRMSLLQKDLPPGVLLVTLTTDPDFDTPPVLAEYGRKHAAAPERWSFLTGTKAQIAQLAVDSLKLTALEVPPEKRESAADLFVHSTLFVLVDGQGRLRSTFLTEEYDPEPDGSTPRGYGDPGPRWAAEIQPRILKTMELLQRQGNR